MNTTENNMRDALSTTTDWTKLTSDALTGHLDGYYTDTIEFAAPELISVQDIDEAIAEFGPIRVHAAIRDLYPDADTDELSVVPVGSTDVRAGMDRAGRPTLFVSWQVRVFGDVRIPAHA
jgi:hypothetical protein